MTTVSGPCRCYANYLLNPHEDPESLLINALGPKQPLFALIADLAEHRHIELLQQLYSGTLALHAAFSEDTRLDPHQEFTGRYGAPFVPGEQGPSHALRVLAGLGLVLAQEPPPEEPLRAAIGWYAEARGCLPGRSGRWSPARIAGDDPGLRRRLELLAQVAGDECDRTAVLTAAITLRRLAHPTRQAPARRRWLRSPQPAIGVLFDQGRDGVHASLTAARLAGTPSALVPDPERMSLFTADEPFQRALDLAWSQAGQQKINGTVLWSAISREGPCPRATGESAGAAFAVVLDEVRRLQRRLSALTVFRRLVQDTSITGKIGAKGSLESVQGYPNKLKAVPEHAKVVVPAADAGQASIAAASRDLQIVPARRWRDAAHVARRRSRLVLLRQSLVVTVVLALAGGVFAVVQAHAAQQRALSVNLANQSNSAVGVNLRDADLYALAAWQSAHTGTALSSLLSRAADPYAGSFAEAAGFTVAATAISPDSRLLAVAGLANPQDAVRSTVQLWDIATRRLLAAYAVPNAVRAVAFSPDGRTLAATPATRNGNMQLWSVATRRELPDPVAERGDEITSVAYSPNSRLLAVGVAIPPRSDGGQPLNLATVPAVIDLWDMATHRLVRRLGGLAGPVWSLDFSDDGRLLASGGYDHTARVWDPATGRERAVLTGTAAQVVAVAFEPATHFLATSGADSKIRVWNADNGTPYLSIHTAAGAAAAFAFNPDGTYLYAGLDLNNTYRVDLVSGTIDGAPLRLQQPVTSMAASPDGRTLMLGGPGGSLAALAIDGRTFYNLNQSPLTAAAVNRSGQLAATGAADGTMHVWPVSDPAAAATLPDGPAAVVSAAFSPDGHLLAVGHADCRVALWDLSGARHLTGIDNAKRAAELAAPGTSGAPRVVDIAFSRDGTTLATYCVGNATPGSAVATLWDTRTFRPLAVYRPPGALFAGGMAYNGHTIALDTGTGGVLLWDTRLRRVTGQIPAGAGTHYALAFTPDGRLLAVTGADTVQLWNVSSRVQVASTTVNTSVFHQLAVSPDGSTLAASSQDSTVQLWQLPGLQPIAALSPQVPPLATGTTPVAYNGLAYSPDGRTLVTASSDGTAQVWDTNPADAVRNLCDALRGPRLASQWRQLGPGPGPDPCP